jgi:hypothetical protein
VFDHVFPELLQDAIQGFLDAVTCLGDRPLDFRVTKVKATLRRLREDYRESPARFTTQNIADLQKAVAALELLSPIETIDCPSCFGGGTQRWMVSYKHPCNRCGGAGRVEKTLEAVKENERTWGKAEFPERRKAPEEAF